MATLLADENSDVRAEVYESLQRYPAEGLSGIFGVLVAHREQEPWALVGLVRVLARVVDVGPSAVACALEGPAGSPQRWVQREVLRVLRLCAAADAQASMEQAGAWGGHGNQHVRETSVRWLGLLKGADGDLVMDLLIARAADPSALVRRACAVALGRRAVRSPDRVIPVLGRLAGDRTHHSVRMAVARGLVYWQDGAPYEALAILKSLLNDTAHGVRRVALGRLDQLAREHPAIALAAVTDWHEIRAVRRRVVVACLKTVAASTEPQAAARAAGILDGLARGQDRTRSGAA